MTLKEYQTIIEKTAVYPKEVGIGYTVLGLIGESVEFSSIVGENWAAMPGYKPTKEDILAITKEAGDVCWYITATCNELSIDVSTVMEGSHSMAPFEKELIGEFLTHPIEFSAYCAERAKKWLRDGTMNEEIKDEIAKNMRALYRHVKGMCEFFGIEMEDVLETNYNKLIKRRETNTLHGSGDNREENV